MESKDNFHDSHYADMEIQPIEIMQALMTRNEFQHFLFGTIVKYHRRAGHKQGESFRKDLTKRDRYIQWYYTSSVLGKYINPNDVGVSVPTDFKMNLINSIDSKYRWLKKCKQIINSGVNEQ